MSHKASTKNHVAFAAATGSGKTLAYLLPIFQKLKTSENKLKATQSHSHSQTPNPRPSKRPRALVLAPTRELAAQILSVCKVLSHSTKLSVVSVVGGGSESAASQKKSLNRPVDIVVGTPGRVVKLWEDGSMFLGKTEVSE